MNEQQVIDASKFLSWALRHSPGEVDGLVVDDQGWADINALLDWAQTRGTIGKTGKRLTRTDIDAVLAAPGKQRFMLDGPRVRIRASQGHSTSVVQMKHEPLIPPSVLYHGTATRFMDSISKTGLTKQQRHHVHMSEDKTTAIAVGKRYGKVVLLRIDADAMFHSGHVFYRADNGVWLTDSVPPQFMEVDNG